MARVHSHANPYVSPLIHFLSQGAAAHNITIEVKEAITRGQPQLVHALVDAKVVSALSKLFLTSNAVMKFDAMLILVYMAAGCQTVGWPQVSYVALPEHTISEFSCMFQ